MTTTIKAKPRRRQQIELPEDLVYYIQWKSREVGLSPRNFYGGNRHPTGYDGAGKTDQSARDMEVSRPRDLPFPAARACIPSDGPHKAFASTMGSMWAPAPSEPLH